MKINEINDQNSKTNEISDRVGSINKRKISSSKTNKSTSNVVIDKNNDDLSSRVGVMKNIKDGNHSNNHSFGSIGNQNKIIIDQNTKNNVSTKLNVLDLPPIVKIDESIEISPTTNLNIKTSIGNSIGSSKLKKFSILLIQDNIDFDELKKISWSGSPPELRSQIWKYLIVKKKTKKKKLKNYFYDFKGIFTL